MVWKYGNGKTESQPNIDKKKWNAFTFMILVVVVCRYLNLHKILKAVKYHNTL